MEKVTIINRDNKRIVVAFDIQNPQRGLVFIAHGLGGFKEQPHIQIFAEAFREHQYSVVTWDATNSVGESDGKMEDATTTNYLHDLEDVIAWSTKQVWYQEPFVVCGHSLGSFCAALYAENNPKKVKALAPISTNVSGTLFRAAQERYYPEEYAAWQREGIREWESASKPGMIKRLKWLHLQDQLRYDLLPNINVLKMPILLIVGELDDVTPREYQQIFYNALHSKHKELHIVKGAPHTFMEPEHLKEVKEIFNHWIERYC